jgi:hypothetical protein
VKRKPDRPTNTDRIASLVITVIIALVTLLALMLVRRYYPAM